MDQHRSLELAGGLVQMNARMGQPVSSVALLLRRARIEGAHTHVSLVFKADRLMCHTLLL